MRVRGSTGWAWPFTGRERERRAGLDALAQTGTPPCVVILGAPGVGKTRLAQEIVRSDEVASRTWHVVTACVGLREIPLGAFAPFVPLDAPNPPDEFALWRQISARLGLVGAERVGLMVDDAQWLDAVSAGFLQQLAACNRAALVLTLRDPEATSPAVAAVARDATCIDLETLAPEAVSELLEVTLGAPVETASKRRLVELSAGNPLYLRQLVEASVQRGVLQIRDGTWVVVGPLTAPTALVAFVRDRVRGLDEGARDVLELIAIAGELPVSATALEGAARSLTLLESAGLITEATDTGRRIVRTAHPLFAEAVVASMPSRRRRTHLDTLVHVFSAEEGNDPTTAMRVAVWRLEADAAQRPDDLVGAATTALARCDFTLAQRLAEEAMGRGAVFAGGMCAAEAVLKQRDPARAAAMLRTICSAASTDHDRARFAMLLALCLGGELGRVDEAVDHLTSTIAELPAGADRNLIEAYLASLLVEAGEIAAGGAIAEQRIAAVAEDPVAALWSVMPAGFARSASGRPIATIAMCDELMPIGLVHAAHDPYPLAWLLAQRSAAEYLAGRVDDATAGLDSAAGFAHADGDPTLISAVGVARGGVEVHVGRLRTGLKLEREATALLRLDDRHGILATALCMTASALAQLGDVAGAVAAAREAEDVAWPYFVGRFEHEIGLAWAGAVAGEAHVAEKRLATCADECARQGAIGTEILVRYDAFRMGLPAADHAPRLAQLRGHVDGRLLPAMCSHVIAADEQDPVALGAAGDALERLGFALPAAEAFTSAAAGFSVQGLAARAARMTVRRDAALERCEDPRTPRLSIGDTVDRLTAREREVATRAARGASNRELAAALGVSVRTVETHLQHAYEKLGVNRRGDLAAAIGLPST